MSELASSSANPTRHAFSARERELLITEAWAYEDIAAKTLECADVANVEAIIVLRGVCMNKWQGIDALVRSKVIYGIARGDEDYGELLDTTWGDPSFELLRKKPHLSLMFARLVGNALRDMPPYCGKVLARSRAEWTQSPRYTLVERSI